MPDVTLRARALRALVALHGELCGAFIAFFNKLHACLALNAGWGGGVDTAVFEQDCAAFNAQPAQVSVLGGLCLAQLLMDRRTRSLLIQKVVELRIQALVPAAQDRSVLHHGDRRIHWLA